MTARAARDRILDDGHSGHRSGPPVGTGHDRGIQFVASFGGEHAPAAGIEQRRIFQHADRRLDRIQAGSVRASKSLVAGLERFGQAQRAEAFPTPESCRPCPCRCRRGCPKRLERFASLRHEQVPGSDNSRTNTLPHDRAAQVAGTGLALRAVVADCGMRVKPAVNIRSFQGGHGRYGRGCSARVRRAGRPRSCLPAR